MDYYFWAIACLIGAIAVLKLLAMALEAWEARQDGGFTSAYSGFMDDCRARGLSYADSMDEWRLRTLFAEMRHASTRAACANIGEWKKAIDTAQQQAFDQLAKEGRRDLMPIFGSMLKGTTYADILYPEASRQVDKIAVGKLTPLTVHQYAALRVVK